jgi:hypothetical protein
MFVKGAQVAKLAVLERIPLFQEDDDGMCFLDRTVAEVLGQSHRPLAFEQASIGRFVKTTLRDPYPDYVAIVALYFVDHKKHVELIEHARLNHQYTEEVFDAHDESIDAASYTLVSSKISAKDWTLLCFWVLERLHIVEIEHPMHAYATKTIPQLPIHERSRVAETLKVKSTHMLGLIHNLQQTYPPVRPYAVVLKDPCPFPHSCLATATLECVEENVNVTALYEINSVQEISICRIDAGFSVEERQQSLSTLRAPACHCLLCGYELFNPFNDQTSEHDWLRVAHHFLARGHLDTAKTLYQQVLAVNSSQLDAWHALGAIELSGNRFLQAQQTWKKGAINIVSQTQHAGLSLQMSKLGAYRYLDESITLGNQLERDELDYKLETVTSPIPNVFVTRMLCPNQCKQILTWAKDGTWTQNRHYAVPTHDVPVHTVPSLLEWFTFWFTTQMRPRLAQHFGTSQNYYTHDAFVVRYQATDGSNYLPIHSDESTHSLILALNNCDEYSGGGTYFCEHDTVVRTQVGEVLSFRGDRTLHGGESVTKGTRYILAVFLYHDDENGDEGIATARGTACGTKRERDVCQVLREAKESKIAFSFDFL